MSSPTPPTRKTTTNTTSSFYVSMPLCPNQGNGNNLSINDSNKIEFKSLFNKHGIICSHCVTLDGRENPEISENSLNNTQQIIKKILSSAENIIHSQNINLTSDEFNTLFSSSSGDILTHTSISQVVIVKIYDEKSSKHPQYILLKQQNGSITAFPSKRNANPEIKQLTYLICKEGLSIPIKYLRRLFNYSIDSSNEEKAILNSKIANLSNKYNLVNNSIDDILEQVIGKANLSTIDALANRGQLALNRLDTHDTETEKNQQSHKRKHSVTIDEETDNEPITESITPKKRLRVSSSKATSMLNTEKDILREIITATSSVLIPFSTDLPKLKLTSDVNLTIIFKIVYDDIISSSENDYKELFAKLTQLCESYYNVYNFVSSGSNISIYLFKQITSIFEFLEKKCNRHNYIELIHPQHTNLINKLIQQNTTQQQIISEFSQAEIILLFNQSQYACIKINDSYYLLYLVSNISRTINIFEIPLKSVQNLQDCSKSTFLQAIHDIYPQAFELPIFINKFNINTLITNLLNLYAYFLPKLSLELIAAYPLEQTHAILLRLCRSNKEQLATIQKTFIPIIYSSLGKSASYRSSMNTILEQTQIISTQYSIFTLDASSWQDDTYKIVLETIIKSILAFEKVSIDTSNLEIFNMLYTVGIKCSLKALEPYLQPEYMEKNLLHISYRKIQIVSKQLLVFVALIYVYWTKLNYQISNNLLPNPAEEYNLLITSLLKFVDIICNVNATTLYIPNDNYSNFVHGIIKYNKTAQFVWLYTINHKNGNDNQTQLEFRSDLPIDLNKFFEELEPYKESDPSIFSNYNYKLDLYGHFDRILSFLFADNIHSHFNTQIICNTIFGLILHHIQHSSHSDKLNIIYKLLASSDSMHISLNNRQDINSFIQNAVQWYLTHTTSSRHLDTILSNYHNFIKADFLKYLHNQTGNDKLLQKLELQMLKYSISQKNNELLQYLINIKGESFYLLIKNIVLKTETNSMIKLNELIGSVTIEQLLKLYEDESFKSNAILNELAFNSLIYWVQQPEVSMELISKLLCKIVITNIKSDKLIELHKLLTEKHIEPDQLDHITILLRERQKCHTADNPSITTYLNSVNQTYIKSAFIKALIKQHMFLITYVRPNTTTAELNKIEERLKQESADPRVTKYLQSLNSASNQSDT